MNSKRFVILAAHGAGDESMANASVRDLASRLNKARPDLTIIAAFNLGSPSFATVIDNHALKDGADVFVLPLMTSDGYFANQHLLSQLEMNSATASVHLKVLSPIGVRKDAIDLITFRVQDAFVRTGLSPERTTVVVVGHGTRRSARSADATNAVRDALRSAVPTSDVRSAFLDQDPLLEDVSATIERENILVVPFLIGGGGHETVDIPERLGIDGLSVDEKQIRVRSDGRRVVILPALGTDSAFTKLVGDVLHTEVPRLVETGRVTLVGAGPGSAGLITVRGLQLLKQADVVVFDRLAGRSLLREARHDAELIDAGKAPGKHTLGQDRINAVLVDRALAGQSVVRLKGGDPFVFGRGWEELEACREAGVACEVVPGVTSAIAAPALAGVPVTARGVARTFAVVTPQVESGTKREALHYAALARMDTVSVLMGRAMLGEVVAGFLAAGLNTATPVAVIEQASLPGQRAVGGTLADIQDIADEKGIESPVVVVIGKTAAHAQTEPVWKGGRLYGKRVVVTRPRSASAGLIELLESEGAEVIDCPLIRFEYVAPDFAPARIAEHDWIVFTSLHGVRGFWKWLQANGADSRALAGTRIAAVGPKTAHELERIGLRADLIPETHRAEALIAALQQQDQQFDDQRVSRVLFPCGTLAREEVAQGLSNAIGDVEYHVRELLVYHTLSQPPTQLARDEIERGVDAVMLYSPSAVKSLAESRVNIGNAVLACIGETTATAAEQHGLPAAIVPNVYSDAGLVDALVERFDTAGVCV